MPTTPQRPAWLLPRGVTRALWDYAHAHHIADDYDDYFAHNSLFEFDEAVLKKHFTVPGTLVDLGCGTGRLLVPFARRGFQCVAVDLSRPMLSVVGEKAAAENLAIDRVLANFVELDCLRDHVADYCISMFSTLGMVRGRANRRRTLAHVRRILKPGGMFIVHVHNRWHSLFQREGRRWLLGNRIASLLRSDVEPGDKFFDYRGVPNMFLHVFTRRELLSELRRAGLQPTEVIPLNTERRHRLHNAWFLPRLRANGWIVVCR